MRTQDILLGRPHVAQVLRQEDREWVRPQLLEAHARGNHSVRHFYNAYREIHSNSYLISMSIRGFFEVFCRGGRPKKLNLHYSVKIKFPHSSKALKTRLGYIGTRK